MLFVVGVAALIISVVTGRIELVLAGLVPLFLGAFWPSEKLPTEEDFRELDELDELEKLLDAAEESELSPDALLGVGVVEKLERTQTTINGIPQYRMILRVRGSDMREFTGNLITLIRPHEMVAVAPRALLTVAYEPENPTMLALVPEHRREEARDQFHRQQVQLGLADPQTMEIHERGVPTTGVILTTTPTGGDPPRLHRPGRHGPVHQPLREPGGALEADVPPAVDARPADGGAAGGHVGAAGG